MKSVCRPSARGEKSSEILGKFLLTGDIGSEEELKPKKENRKWTLRSTG